MFTESVCGVSSKGGNWDISYFIVNIGEREIRHTIKEGRKKFIEQGEIKDLVKFICKIFEDRGFFTETKKEPLEMDKLFWGISKINVVNGLLVEFMPAEIIEPKRARFARRRGFSFT